MRSSPVQTYSDDMSQQASSVEYERAVGPGWTARILFWSAIVVGSLPEFVLMPMMIDGVRPEFFTLYPTVTVVVAVLELILGVVALLIVKGSPIAMRLFGMGLLIFSSIYAFALPHLLPIIVNRVVGSLGGFELALTIQSIIWTFHGGVVLAGMLIAWNLARNRAWWTHLVAAGYALCTGVVVAFVEWAMNWLGSSFATSMVFTQLLALAAVFGGLGLLHLLGGVPGGGHCVAVDDSTSRPKRSGPDA
ncbi:hypothetical protein CXR24_03235 [Brevibacterium aurantiacum]|uniref:Uncharacterized protein n=4 Tax=Brevibacterium aurantiacum TaxID=273384 RepID=A0A2A3Z129_BREAU|nr:hypothetical protein CXR24_03235 [Brevibacterium aurantiacum]AZT92294.1 hypothetical protein CXR23_03315 [Brevibacterium aurantiacum]PCC45752.1 hypothetical protein CIK64_13535 [Brevibacterium aurantiacum]PCC52407.1 hypothetical protein CIK59_17060 [Brevibacterium aurantiacum]SMY00755.1 hypothetical protein BAUR920_03343 [Brevibacterium aurantiacum]